MGMVEGNVEVSDNEWERIKKGGEEKIKQWIANEMSGKSCAIVLVGQGTADRKWVNYEINKAWNDRKGVLGVRIHNLKDVNGRQSVAGGNPFDHVHFTETRKPLSSVVKLYNPVGATSKEVYDTIKNNLADWVEEAITLRG
jgi:hypothetical protein